MKKNKIYKVEIDFIYKREYEISAPDGNQATGEAIDIFRKAQGGLDGCKYILLKCDEL